MRLRLISALLSAFAALPASSASNLCATNATLGAAVISVLNLTYPSLSEVAAAVARSDLGGACAALSEYYSSASTAAWLRRPLPPPSSRRVGGGVDAAVFRDVYDEGDLGTGTVPRNADGGLDWLYRGSRDDPEYQNVLNRFSTFLGALGAWSATGNDEYVRWLDATMIDWATHNPCPGGELQRSAPRCYPRGDGTAPACGWGPRDAPGSQACAAGYTESPWRLLEQGIRFAGAASGVGAPWPDTFFGLQRAANFSTSARALAVLVAGEHLASLQAAGSAGVSNWAITQSTGLIELALVFPELRGAAAARDAALANLLSLLRSGVYPDGCETEQASGYGMNTALDFFAVLQLLELAGDAQPPAAYRSAVEQMFDFYAYTSDPLGCLPRNGDSDVCGDGFSAAAAAYFNRSDWAYVHSGGANGTRPAPASGSPSSAFAWAGQVAFRSGYSRGATWAWFDAGPYGSSVHGHRDKLALNVHARGAMLLVDSGRFAYSGSDLSAVLHRAYARNATAHNTLTIDGCDQLPQPAVAAAPLPADAVALAPEADAAFASMAAFDGACLVGAATHSRGVHFARDAGAGGGGADDGDFLLVVDVVASPAQPRSVQAHWHSHPNASAFALNTSSGAARIGGARWSGEPLPAQACLLPATGGSGGWQRVSVHAGDQPPAASYQGWFSHSYDDANPARTLVYEGQTGAAGLGVWAWLIVPSAQPRACDLDGARVLGANESHVRVAVNLEGQAEREVAVRYK